MALKIFFSPEFSKYFSTAFFFLVDESMSAKELNFYFPNTNPLANILITDLVDEGQRFLSDLLARTAC